MPIHIVNVGSSFAAGLGIPPQVDSVAGRSEENYAHIIARRLDAKLTDLSVSGSTLLNLLSEPQVARGRTYRPQIYDIPEDADVVLILGGGNDIGYIGGLFMDSFDAYWIFRIMMQVYGWLAGTVGIEAASIDAEGLALRYGAVLDSIHTKAPKAQVLVVEYLSLLGPDLVPGIDVPFGGDLLSKHKDKADQLRRATILATQGREQWCSRVPVTEISHSHGLGSREPWVSGFNFRLLFQRNAYHPNADGMQAVAEIIHRKLTELNLVS